MQLSKEARPRSLFNEEGHKSYNYDKRARGKIVLGLILFRCVMLISFCFRCLVFAFRLPTIWTGDLDFSPIILGGDRIRASRGARLCRR